MPFPTISDLANRLYRQVAQIQDPASDEQHGWVLAKVCGAALDGLQWVADALDETDDHPPAGQLLDPDVTPEPLIGWLAQFAGVRPTKGASEAVRRGEVRTAAGWKRGRELSLVEDVQRTLTGTKTVEVVTFVDENRWRAAFRTLPAETPDTAATLRAAMGQKPYGVVLAHVVSDGPAWDEPPAATTWDDVDNAVTWDSVTLEDVEA